MNGRHKLGESMFTFITRKRSVASMHLHVRRLMDVTFQGSVADVEAQRSSARYVRCFPVLVAPWVDDEPAADDAVFGIANNISPQGFGLIVPKAIESAQVCLGVHTPGDESDAFFLLGDSKHVAAIGGGFWSLGVELTDFATESCPYKLGRLKKLAAGLRPESMELAGR